MGDSIWKKEISFGRKAKEPKAPPEPKPEKTSVWKKEISLGRKAKEPKAPPAPKLEAEPKQSIWKKEVSLGRKQKRDREVERLAQEAAHAVAPVFEPVELSPPEALPPTVLAEATVAAMPDPEAVPPAPEPVAEAVAPEPVAPPPAAPEPVTLAAVPDPGPEPAPTAFAPAEPQPLDAAAAVEVPVLAVDELAPAAPASGPPAPEPVPVVASTLSPAIVEASAEAPPPPAAEPAPAPAPEPVLEQGPVEPWMEPVPALPPVPVEPWLAEPELPPAPEPAPPVVVYPPVPAAELPPLPEPKQSLLKKEISFGRKPKAPKAPKAPKPPKLPGDSTPFWKKELSFSRRPKTAAVAVAAEALPKPKREPFWKRELSVSRPKMSVPKRASGAKGGGGHKVKRFVGLKVGASQLAAARVANNGAAELLQLAREPLEQGIVVSGELRDPDALAEALKRFFARNKLPRKNVRLGIASNRIGVRIFDVTGIDDDKQLENAIHFRAQETLPIPLDEAVLDYHVLSESVDGEGNATRRVLLVVAYRELVDRYVSACRKAGISLAGIDLEAFALLRALSAPRPESEPSDSALVAVAIGHDRSTFAVSDGRICEFTRVLEWGGANLNVAIARALNLAPSEVEAIKRSISLVSNEVPQGIAPEQYALALDAVRKQVQGFARELVSSLQFYQNQPGSLGIGEIAITGGTASLVGLAEELQRLIGVHVRLGDPLARLKVGKRVAGDEQVGSLAVAIGLGIED